MLSLSSTVFYLLIFFAVYVQVFFLTTFLENRKKVVIRNGATKLSRYPAVTIIVPCWNEEKTIYRTVRSIFNLNYPSNKIKIFLVDDGSTDGTWNVIQKFKKYKNVTIFRKENGGKHTALNLGLQHVDTPFLGCLDADSMVDPEALVRIMERFELDSKAMAVTPSLIVNNPKGVIQNAQKVEYQIGVFAKRVLDILGAIHVAPGPLTIFRKEVFSNLGPYAHAHNTEDMEIAYRMQRNHYKITFCSDAFVYTNTPPTAMRLYRQRLRWIYGFLNNTLDYRDIMLRKKYGNFALFTIPAGVVGIFSVWFIIARMVYQVSDFAVEKIRAFQTVGFELSLQAPKLDPFFWSADAHVFLAILVFAFVITSIVFGRRMTEGKWGLTWSAIYFFAVFPILAPFWLLRAVFNTIIAERPSWR